MRKYAAIIAATAFMVVGLFSINMGMDHEAMSGCVFTNSSQADSGCGMSVTEHLTWWQTTFTGVPVTVPIMAMLAVLVMIVAFADILLKWKPRISIRRSKAPPGEKLHNFITLFMAAGKTQPLLYA